MSSGNNKTRKEFSRKFKRKVLLEYLKGKKPDKIFSEFGVEFTNDKKYASKLIHKWKEELYKNFNILALSYINIDKNYSKTEINSIGSDEEEDKILDELLTKNNNNEFI